MKKVKRPPRGTRRRDVPLTEARICAAALRLIDADGVEALTMRKLATALDANPMSLYHHVPNRDALLRGAVRMVGAQFRTVTLEDAPWQERIRLLATDFRTLAHRHPNLMAYSFSQPDFIQPEDPFWAALIATLDVPGVPRSEIRQVAALMCAVVIGVLIAELNGSLHQWSSLDPTAPAAGEDGPPDAGPDEERMFRLVLDTIITGLESRLTADDDGQGADRDGAPEADPWSGEPVFVPRQQSVSSSRWPDPV
ncbi:TetR/AcrR family transcriptional regulator [Streptomyces dengpaensis]|uniref:TetR/AcrR family transcriptional regulator n=2 Tax=Streptomyces TaxID=1883 RepID=A0ABM6T2K0_9ACTN|nr:TetR/AcrR family transcriptional regulator [Streptomyces dengpaensis]AVH61304.1 TetR/AcrR family transcriptional regulator [Streptomyces dengpaensis]PIB07856.1 TetR family transcriptional regulator [Streptomyces sp. HG99]